MLENEKCFRKNRETKKYLRKIWKVMQESVDRGLIADGMLPGKIKVERRAAIMYEKFLENQEVGSPDYLDYASICAIAVNEENANMNRVVTAPTNGASGIIPATMMYINEYIENKPDEVAIHSPDGGFDWTSHHGWSGARFTGIFRANESGRHYFWVVADDSAELWLNGSKCANSGGNWVELSQRVKG